VPNSRRTRPHGAVWALKRQAAGDRRAKWTHFGSGTPRLQDAVESAPGVNETDGFWPTAFHTLGKGDRCGIRLFEETNWRVSSMLAGRALTGEEAPLRSAENFSQQASPVSKSSNQLLTRQAMIR
jgi:hypothetical protein